MKKINYILIFSFLFSGMFLASCEKEEALDVDFSKYNVDDYVKGPLDDWLTQEFLDPYNISVEYRWQRSLSPVNKDITPPKEEKVQPAMEAIRDVWIKPYMEVAGAAFFKPIAPKQIVLVGSPEYNDNGTITLGTAEGGRKIYLTVINNFDKSNGAAVKRMMRTVHHEFAHIINQVVSIPPEFGVISPEFTSNWTSESAADAKALGFISQYARMNPGEDFAEMTSHLLIEGQYWFDEYVASAPETAQDRLRQKEQIVVDYFNLSFGIDFRALQDNIQQKLEVVTPPTPFAERLQDNGFAQMTIDLATQSVKSAAYEAVWNETTAALAAIGNAGRSFQRMEFHFDGVTELRVRYIYQNTAGTTFNADVDFDMVVDDDGTTTFTLVENRGDETAYGNFGVVGAGFQPMQDYLQSSVFIAKWVTDILPNTRDRKGGFAKKDNPSSYFYGDLTAG
ncbi:zinc-binding metallopeptidase [Albibacterium profundi]|uniref:Zinc-binding metallopeptidase n=1 Tax=Albibacterium profundi TaxID=3134906 RepID=A0ABV5CD38_9SPHI